MRTWILMLVATIAIVVAINTASDAGLQFGDAIGIAARIEALQ